MPISSEGSGLCDATNDYRQRSYDHGGLHRFCTVLGVLQAVNTYEHHEGTIRGATRPDRTMLRAITGEYEQLDHTTWNTLTKALQTV